MYRKNVQAYVCGDVDCLLFIVNGSNNTYIGKQIFTGKKVQVYVCGDVDGLPHQVNDMNHSKRYICKYRYRY